MDSRGKRNEKEKKNSGWWIRRRKWAKYKRRNLNKLFSTKKKREERKQKLDNRRKERARNKKKRERELLSWFLADVANHNAHINLKKTTQEISAKNFVKSKKISRPFSQNGETTDPWNYFIEWKVEFFLSFFHWSEREILVRFNRYPIDQ